MNIFLKRFMSKKPQKNYSPDSSEKKIKRVKKRNGAVVAFEQEKITQAIFKAITAVGQGDGEKSKQLSDRVVQLLGRRIKEGQIPQVEQIQDIVEEVLMLDGLVETAKAYILYREQRRKIREIKKLERGAVGKVDQYLEEIDWEVKENANMAYSLQGLNNYISSFLVKKYWLEKIYPREVRKAVARGDFHLHDLQTLGAYCSGWDLYDLLLQGFGGVAGKIQSKPPKHFRAALGQIVNFLYTIQGETAGAVAFSNFDTLLAPFIRYDSLSYLEAKQALQEFLFNANVPTRVGFQSLVWDELVVIKKKGKVNFFNIGELIDEEFEKNVHRVREQARQSYAVENHEDYQVLSFDADGKAIWAKVKAFVRHRVPKNSEFLNIRTSRGEARVSRAHSLFGFERLNNEFNPRPVSAGEVEVATDYRHLKAKNHFIALNKMQNQGQKEELDLIELLEDFPHLHKNVMVKINPTHTLNSLRGKVLDEFQSLTPFYKRFGLKDRGVWHDWLERKSIRYDVWKKYGDSDKEVELKLKNSQIWYPRFLRQKELESFVKLCAWYISEEVLKITGKGLLSEIISQSGGFLSFQKIIPWFIFELSPGHQKCFIKTLLKGDGSEYENHWDFTTTSEKLSLGLSLLLAQNDTRFSVYTEKVSKRNKNWRDQYIIRVFKSNNSSHQYRVRDFEARVCLRKDKFYYDKEFEYDISVDLPQENFIGGTGLLAFHNTPFENITLDVSPSSVFAKQPVIIGGKPQKETYSEFQGEMDTINKAFYEVMLEGDAQGRVFTFPIPTINITKDFPWDKPALAPMWEATAKYGINYFGNYINSDMSPEDVTSMCCRLRLNLAELYNRGGGGLFGAGSLTGSIGVATINLPRIGYLSQSQKDFFQRLGRVMDLVKESLEIKRKTIEKFTEKGLYPYSKHWLANIKKMRNQYWANHFSTIGLTGMNEALLNFMDKDIGSKGGRKFALEVLDFMREKLVGYQKETGNLYNLEATPAESTAYRLALKDREKHPDIIAVGTKEVPYYTNSTQLPVNYTNDVFKALKLQDGLQSLYTGGSVFHVFLGERIQDPNQAKKLIKKIFENFKLPYISLTPTFSICPSHGYLSGEHQHCPRCTIKQPCEVYSRIVGYLRPVSQWNAGKQQEFKERKTFGFKNA